MKKLILLIFVTLIATVVGMAQTAPPAQDVLGAHNASGRGCVVCHAPHSGVLGNGKASTADINNGMYALWGQDLSPLYGLTFNFSGDGAATYPVTLPYSSSATAGAATPVSTFWLENSTFHDPNTTVLFCLSCHDGVYTSVGIMTGTTVEALPLGYGHAPTLLGAQAPSNGTAYNNDHPVGDAALVSCGGSYNWDCSGGGTSSTKINMKAGPLGTAFLTNNPSSFWNSSSGLATAVNGAVSAVTCTTCHNQHSMTAWKVGTTAYSTMFFIRGYYNPASGGNTVAQFCRNCHGGESNEMNGVTSYGGTT